MGCRSGSSLGRFEWSRSTRLLWEVGGDVGGRIDDGSTMDQTVGGDLGGRVEVISLKWLIDDSNPCASKSSND